MRNPEMSHRRGEWAMARIALDKCLRFVEAEGSEVDTYRVASMARRD